PHSHHRPFPFSALVLLIAVACSPFATQSELNVIPLQFPLQSYRSFRTNPFALNSSYVAYLTIPTSLTRLNPGLNPSTILNDLHLHCMTFSGLPFGSPG